MFKIICENETVKLHYASNKEIASEVAVELTERFAPCTVSEEEKNEVMWDPGGMMTTGDTEIMFRLNDIIVMCRLQHYNYFVEAIHDYVQPRGNEAKYYKIHGKWFCICLSEKDFELLKELLNDKDTATMANEADIKRESDMRALEDAGYIQRVVIGEDNKLYKAPLEDGPIDKNLLN